MEAQLPFSTKVWVVEEAVGRGLVVVMRAVDMRSRLLCAGATTHLAVLAVARKKQPSNRSIKHVTNVLV